MIITSLASFYYFDRKKNQAYRITNIKCLVQISEPNIEMVYTINKNVIQNMYLNLRVIYAYKPDVTRINE